MSTGKPHLTEAECLAMGDEWAMLSRRSEKWIWLVQCHNVWMLQKDIRTPHGHLQSFLDQRQQTQPT